MDTNKLIRGFLQASVILAVFVMPLSLFLSEFAMTIVFSLMVGCCGMAIILMANDM